MILDPTQTYADIHAGSDRVAALITGVSEVPDWAMQGRQLILVPAGVTVQVGYVYHNGVFGPAAQFVPVDNSNIDNLPKWAKALGLLIAQYANKTPAQVKSDFLTIYNSLP